MHFKSKSGTVTNHEDIEATATFNQQAILQRIETFQNLGSNWRILNIEAHYLNADTMCFMWCHIRHLRPKKNNATKITAKDREFSMTLNYDGINFPVKVSDIGKIERMNEINITVLG